MAKKQTIALGWADDMKPYLYELPEMPPEEEILGHGLPKKQQYWANIRPQLINDFKSEVEWGRDEMKVTQWKMREQQRKMKGVWFYNNGEPTYVNGANYFYLMYMKFPKFKTKDRRPDYRRYTRDNFLFREFCMLDETCYGSVTFKPRRIGYTAEEIAWMIWILTTGKYRTGGVQSMTAKKTYDTFFGPLTKVLRDMPEWICPVFRRPSNNLPKTTLEFDEGKYNTDVKTLGSILMQGAQVVDSFDGDNCDIIVGDEVWKWKKVDPYEWLNTHKESVYDMGITGKIHLTSTMGESDDKFGPAVEAGKRIWEESDYFARNSATGHTDSGLYQWFVPSDIALGKFINKYGNPDREAALKFCMGRREGKKEGSPEYIAEIRKYPLTIEEVMEGSGSASTFAEILPRVIAQLGIIKKTPLFERDYVEGKFIMDVGTGFVKFEHEIGGKWKVARHPHKLARNRFTFDIYGNMVPFEDREFAIGIDPQKAMDTKGNRLSNTAVCVTQKYQFDWIGGSDKIEHNFGVAAQFDDRQASPRDSLMEGIKAAKYYGAKAMVERNAPGQINLFKEFGMAGFLTKSKYDQLYGLYTNKGTTEDAVNMAANLLASKDPDRIKSIVIPVVLEQLNRFDPNNTREFDAAMSFFMSLFELENLKPFRSQATVDLMEDTIIKAFYGNKQHNYQAIA